MEKPMQTIPHSRFKAFIVFALVVGLTAVHYTFGGQNMDIHLFHRELFFIPILLGAFWFGMFGGVVTAVASVALYIPRLFFMHGHLTWTTLGFQAVVFLMVGALLGWLSDRANRQRQAALDAERQAVVGRAATAVAGEMAEILGALRRMALEKPENLGLDIDFQAELSRLQTMVEALSNYAPVPKKRLSTDINTVIKDQAARFQKTAEQASVRIMTYLDDKGCPIHVNAEQLGDVVAALIRNAIEASPSDGVVEISSRRSGSCCELFVKDQGPGIEPEIQSKIFTPFFTTKPGGSGLALAAGRKVISTMGGELTLYSAPGEETRFTITIPREGPDT